MADEKITQTENSQGKVVKLAGIKKPKKYPYTDADSARLADYVFYDQLFEGAHFEAFKQKIKSEDFNKAYAKLRYIYVNFAGMISKIVADMLFGEPLAVKSENKEVQAWLEDLWRENSMNIQCYESELDNSSLGDALFKLRVGPRRFLDKESTIIIDQTPPSIYFPHIDDFNVSAEPQIKELAWIFAIDKEKYLRREIHMPGQIMNEVYKMKGSEVGEQQPLSVLNIPNLPDAQNTGIDRHMLLHIPNWKKGTRHWGYSDYHDLDSLFFGINNRLSKIDNVLDTHTDPFLMVPSGVIDEKTGKVKRDGRVIEMGEGEDGKPEYIVWDASLENAFKQIDKMVEFIWLTSEVSPASFGMDKGGMAESGRALKYKLLRTIAKVNRKKLYYDKQIKETLYVAQLLSKAHGAKVGGKVFNWELEMPELVWQDGLPNDEVELVDVESKKVDAGLSSQKDAVMKVHNIDEDNAQKKVDEINKEKQAKMPKPLDPQRNPFTKKDDQEVEE